MAETKTKKLPKIFRRPIPNKRFEKKILRRIFLAKEREFLLSLAKKDDQDRYVISGDLSKADARRLAVLAKSIKKNKGLVTGWKAAILTVIVASLLIFNLFFKDRLAEAGMEAALESVFRARAEADGVRLSLFKGSISFESLAVADRSKPMQNLFELSYSELRVNIWELLKKRLIIERAVCSGIQLGTPREVSGALPNTEAGDKGFSPEESSSSGLDALLADTDPEALLQTQLDRLKSPAFIDDVNLSYRQAIEKWPDRIEGLSDDLEEGKVAASRIAALRIDEIDTLDEGADAAKVIQENYPDVENAASAVRRVTREFRQDRENLTELQRGIQEAIEEDYRLLESVVADPGRELSGIASQAAENLLKARIGKYYDYALKAIDTSNRLASEKEKSEDTRARRKGTVVQFPVRGYPRFMIEELFISYGSSGSGEYLEAAVLDISSSQEIAGRPVRFSLNAEDGSHQLTGEGSLDTRDAAEEFLTLKGGLSGGGFDIGDSLSGLGLEKMKGSADGRIEFTIDREMRGAGTAEILLDNMDPVFQEDGDLLQEAVRQVLSGTRQAVFTVSFEAGEEGFRRFRVSSDLDKLFAERVGDYLNTEAARLRERLKGLLQKELASALERNEELDKLLGTYGGELAEDVREVNSLEELAQSRKKRLDARIEEIRNEDAAEVKDQAEKLIEDAAKDFKLPF
jgi:uncharacterized protein (TIGR03545 family)